MPDKQAMIAAIETHCRAENAKDKETWFSLWAEDVVIEDPVGTSTFTGIEELRTRFWDAMVAADPKLTLEQDVIVCGNEAIAICAAEIGPQDTRIRLDPIVSHFTFNEDGKIARLRAFYKF